MRVVLLVISKIKSIFVHSVSFWARVEHSQISKKAKICRHCVLNHAEVGDYSYVSPDTRVIHASIGKFCSVGGDCVIGMGTHTMDYLSTSPVFTMSNNATGYCWTNENLAEEYQRITIGNDVWIGQRVIVMGGINIGDGAVVGAGAVVTHDVPPYAVVAGVPAKIIRYRFDSATIADLQQLRWWDKSDKWLKDNISMFQKPYNK